MTIKRLAYGLIGVAALAAAPVVQSLGVFTDSAAVGSNSFSTGTIDISTNPISAVLSLSGIFPGDSTTAQLSVSNAGTGQLRYAMSTSIAGSATLAGTLQLKVKSGLGTCNSANMDDALQGTTLFDGLLDAAAIGSAAQGAQAGDRTLNASASENLCFKLSLPLAAGNAVQNLSSTATFTFDAEQTANNA